MIQFLKEAANVVPSQKQLDWFDMETYAFVHFGINTYTGKEWGGGSESPQLFNPTELDCDQWVEAVKSAGLKGMIVTAKHHDGFCLWPSEYTEHSVKNSPYQGDVVKEVAEACRRGGIKFGFYLSPWDMNNDLYGTSEYNNYFCNQLTELLTNYGDVFCVWFDNACGEGPNGKKQEYDFPRYIELIQKHQPNAVIFNDYGPDIRWCGNEAGIGRVAEWAVIPKELTFYSEVQTGPGPLASEGNLDYIYNTDEYVGSMPNILYSSGLTFTPSEIDMSIRKGWFWHEEEDPHSLNRLFNTYLTSVGGNACLNLNIPPMPNGRFDDKDVLRLAEFGELLKQEFGNPLNKKIVKDPKAPKQQAVYTVECEVPVSKLKYVVLEEDLTYGQRVESFQIIAKSYNGNLHPLYQGTTIGHKRICQLVDPFAIQNPLIDINEERVTALIIKITAAREEVIMKDINIF